MAIQSYLPIPWYRAMTVPDSPALHRRNFVGVSAQMRLK
jgi:hypothetical protein